MADTIAEYIQGSDLADLDLRWQDSDGDVIDFSTGSLQITWTYTLTVS